MAIMQSRSRPRSNEAVEGWGMWTAPRGIALTVAVRAIEVARLQGKKIAVETADGAVVITTDVVLLAKFSETKYSGSDERERAELRRAATAKPGEGSAAS